jgi:hypothetical protein
MTTQLPRRPFRALPPPSGGLDSVRREARRRRRRRATAVAAGGTGVAAVAVAVVVSTASGGFAVLKPMPPAGGGGPTSHPSVAPGAVHHAPPSTSVPTSRGSGASVGVPSHGRPAGDVTGQGPARRGSVATSTQPSGRRGDPRLERYRSTNPGPSFKSTELCGEGVSYGDGADASVGWCFGVSATRQAGAERLTVHLCRDNTSGGRLSFPSAREVDITVRQGSKTVWDWGHDHPDQPGAHQLAAPVNGCWNWTLLWSGNTQRGGAAPHGSYTFVATTTAKELRAYQPRTRRFTY